MRQNSSIMEALRASEIKDKENKKTDYDNLINVEYDIKSSHLTSHIV